MSRLIDFYRGEATDAEGRRLEEIWRWSDDDWEEVHDFIQWLFPLPEPSRFNPDAPLLTAADVAAFRADAALLDRLRRSYDRFLSFAGLAQGEGGRVVDGPNLAARAPDVWSWRNHNWLRISRVLRSLSLLGLGRQARALFAWLQAARDAGRFPIDDAFRYWAEAAEAGPG